MKILISRIRWYLARSYMRRRLRRIGYPNVEAEKMISVIIGEKP